jgi:Ca2+-binding RTX toxin-like protein
METISVILHDATEATDIATRLAAIDASMSAISVQAATTITGRNGEDRIEGTRESEHILGLGGDDRLRGRGGDDTVDGGAGDDRVRGDSGNDIVFGGAGNDRVEGKSGNDTVYGGDGEDRVKGGDGDDIVYGGAGDDHVWGGLGNDVLVFAPGSGRDKIHDFNHADDVVDLTAYGLTDIDALLASIVQINLNDSALSLPGGDRLVFDNALPGDFEADDFLLS